MPELSGIYDAAFIQPVARIKENLSIWTKGGWAHYIIDFQESLSPGPAMTVDMVAEAGLTVLPANGAIARRIVTILQNNDLEFTHLRWEPLDFVEGLIWEQAGQQRFMKRNVHSRVDPNTRLRDPQLATTTFWVLGINRDMNLEVRNPLATARPMARFVFWGYRMVLKEWDLSGLTAEVKNKLSQGDRETVKSIIGATTWLPAEGRQA